MRIVIGAMVATMLGCVGIDEQPPATFPDDPIHIAVVDRLGNPDAVTGSGRSFLHYEIANGQTITVIISGGHIVGTEFNESTPNHQQQLTGDARDGE